METSMTPTTFSTPNRRQAQAGRGLAGAFIAALAAATLLQFNTALAAQAQTDGDAHCAGQLAIPMTLDATGHVSVHLAVNGVEGRYLVDSGANTNVLDTAEAKRLNAEVRADPDSGERKATLKAAVGPISLGEQEFAVMSLDVMNVRARQEGREPAAGQLGASFFIQFKAHIDFVRNVLCVTTANAVTAAK